jgi:hypothetical protein
MTTIISEAPVCVELTNKSLISDQVWERLVSYIAKEKDMERPIAERIMDQTLGFLKLIALSPGRTFCPSKMVDIGWHAFLMHTREYFEFCERVNGQYIHHDPTEVLVVVARTGGVTETVRAMKANSITVDEMLWTALGDCDGDGDGSCDASSACGGEGEGC